MLNVNAKVYTIKLRDYSIKRAIVQAYHLLEKDHLKELGTQFVKLSLMEVYMVVLPVKLPRIKRQSPLFLPKDISSVVFKRMNNFIINVSCINLLKFFVYARCTPLKQRVYSKLSDTSRLKKYCTYQSYAT